MTSEVVVEDFSVRTVTGVELLAPTSLRASPGTITAITGPSGAGKTTLLRAVLGHLADGTTRSGGSVHIRGQDVFALDQVALRSFRRAHIAYVSQDPGAALNPTLRIRALLAEAAPGATGAELAAALARVGLSAHCLRRRSGELSGGEQRRVALALALVREVGVVVVDEPIAGLHGRLRNEIADLLRSSASEAGVAVVVSGHDITTLHRVADQVVALGRAPVSWTAPPPSPVQDGPPAVRARAISAISGRDTLLESVDLDIAVGGSVAVVGPSGAGKTTLARVLAGLHPGSSGTLEVNGRRLAVGRSRRSRGDRRRIQLIPQNPLSTLNPKRTVLQALSRPLRLSGVASRDVAHRAAALLDSVDLNAALLPRYPGELSGGQRQRVAIARALAAAPEVLICDEITAALDSETATAIMTLLERTRIDSGIAVLVISHDMALVARHCGRVLVLADGSVVEAGYTAAVLAEPRAPQTRALLV